MGNATQDDARLRQASWTHADNQEWRFQQAADGWLRIEARSGGQFVDTGSCESGSGNLQQMKESNTDCQRFRFQPLGELALFNTHKQ